jgi:hypothetical protein
MMTEMKNHATGTRKGRTLQDRLRLIAGALALCLSSTAAAVELEQVIVLQPGWNSVFLEVKPQPSDPNAVFQGLPISSVWRWNPEGVGVDFLQDPADDLIAQPGWLGYFPPHRPEAILTNLYAIEANTAYLIELEGDMPVTWSVSGLPSLARTEWIQDSFNLRGFHVNPGAAPSFGDFFTPSETHAGQPVYRLATTGVWELVTAPFSTPIRSGEAYWVYCQGLSDYEGPIEIENDFSEGLEYGGGLTTSRLVFKNRGGVPATISVRIISAEPPVPLQYQNIDPVSAEVSWPDLASVLSLEVGALSQIYVDLGVRRSDFEGRRESILEIGDSLGSRRRAFVGASSAFSPPPSAKSVNKDGSVGSSFTNVKAASSNALAGLWVGNVSVSAVSESQLGGLEPEPTGSPLVFRVLIHVDSVGQARLLKEVIQMYEEGTVVPDPESPGFFVVETPGRYVLLTDNSLIPSFGGAEFREGAPVGLRVSTAAYDFPDQSLQMTGSFALGGALSVSITMDPESPTNPTRHVYHPDHDNLDALFLNFQEEAFAIIREMGFDFTQTDPEGKNTKPGWGDIEMGGIFRETITGLHRNDIAVEGVFRLRRVSYTPVLNQ